MRFRGGFTLAEAMKACGSLSEGPPPLAEFSRPFQSLDAPDRSGGESVAVVGPKTRLRDREDLRAMLVVAEPGLTGFPENLPVMRVTDVRQYLSALLRLLGDRIERASPFASGTGNQIAPGAVVEGVLEGNVEVGAGAYVGAGSFVGFGSRIEPRATILSHVVLGRECVIQSGAVLGCAGFGFFEADQAWEAMPHWAGVSLGDRCFIGANTVVAAGVLHPTELGSGCKLDSHVQIAHNVRLGRNCILASQSGIAGSTMVGDGLRMGGAASMSGHLRIGNSVSVAARSGVTKDWPDGSVVAGFPARPLRDWRREEISKRKESQA